MRTPNLMSVDQFCTKHKAFTPGGVRWMIFNRQLNGMQLSGALIFIGRRILIDEDRFFSWLATRSEASLKNVQGVRKADPQVAAIEKVERATIASAVRRGSLTMDVLRALRTSDDGLATEEVCEMLGVSFESKRVHKVLQSLCQNGFIRKEGNNRTAKYFALKAGEE